MKSVKMLMIAAAAFAISSAAQAGVVWTLKATNHEGTEPTLDELLISAEGENLKMTMPDNLGPEAANDHEAIFRGDMGDSGVLYVVDHADESYMKIDAVATGAAVTAMSAQMNDIMAQVMKDLSPEQRAAVNQAPGGMGGMSMFGMGEPPKYETRASNDNAQFGGVSAKRFDVLKDGQKEFEIWAAKVDDVEGGALVRDRLMDMKSFYETAMGPMAANNAAFAFVTGLEGRVPVASKTFRNGVLIEESELTTVNSKTFVDGDWTPPSTYSKDDVGLFDGPQ